MFGATPHDIKSPKYRAMTEYAIMHAELPDGAFFALAEEMHGWEADDWGWWTEVYDMMHDD